MFIWVARRASSLPSFALWPCFLTSGCVGKPSIRVLSRFARFFYMCAKVWWWCGVSVSSSLLRWLCSFTCLGFGLFALSFCAIIVVVRWLVLPCLFSLRLPSFLAWFPSVFRVRVLRLLPLLSVVVVGCCCGCPLVLVLPCGLAFPGLCLLLLVAVGGWVFLLPFPRSCLFFSRFIGLLALRYLRSPAELFPDNYQSALALLARLAEGEY